MASASGVSRHGHDRGGPVRRRAGGGWLCVRAFAEQRPASCVQAGGRRTAGHEAADLDHHLLDRSHDHDHVDQGRTTGGTGASCATSDNNDDRCPTAARLQLVRLLDDRCDGSSGVPAGTDRAHHADLPQRRATLHAVRDRVRVSGRRRRERRRPTDMDDSVGTDHGMRGDVHAG